MNIINILPKEQLIQKSEIEIVEKEKLEYTLLGVFSLTNGLKLFSYNLYEDKIEEIKVKNKDAVEILINDDGLISSETASKEVTIDSRNIHFEALNISNAEKKVGKYKQGFQLFNLKKLNNKIQLY